MLNPYLKAVVHFFVRGLAVRLNPDCRHVLIRTMGGRVVRCNEPSSGTCEHFYCVQHCYHVCGIYNEDDGDDGDEKDIEPFVWEPKTEKGREVMES